MKRRQLVLTCALVLALSSGVVFTACSPNIFGLPSPEEIAAQKEAEEKKAALAPYVGIWEAKSIEDENKGTVTEDIYKDVRGVYLATYGYDFSDDGTGLFVRFGAQKPFTWSVDADGKLTITLAGNAGSYTATVDSSGQMTVEGSDGSKAVLKQVTKTSGDYSSFKYKPFDAMADKGTIAYNFSSTKGEYKMRFKLKTEVDKVLIDNDDLYVRYVGIAKSPDGYSEGYVFEIVNKYSDVLYTEFWLGDITGPLNASGNTFVEPGEKFYFFIPNVSKTPGSLVGISNPKAILTTAYNSAKDGTVTEQKQKTELDLNISPKSE